MLSLKIPEQRINLAVDNDWWITQSQQVDRAAIRASWGATPETAVVLFCAKLQPWKLPLDLLPAIAQVRILLLVYAGEGPWGAEIEREAAPLCVAQKIS